LTFTFDLFDLYFISPGNVSNLGKAAELPASALTVKSHLLEAGADEHAFTEAADPKVFRIGLAPPASEDPAQLGDLVKRVTNAAGSVFAAAGLEPVMTHTGLLAWGTDLQ
jgi:hypothetical protein